MRTIPLLLIITVACWALPAHADLASYEREQKAKTARLLELNDMLQDAMHATPDAFEDPAALHAAVTKMEKLASTVSAELSTDKLRTNGTTFGTVQDNLRLVEQRVKSVKLAERTATALAKLAPIAAAHGEAAEADLDEAARLVEAMRDYRGDLPSAYRALAVRHQDLLEKLAETPWPTTLRPIEISRTDLEARVMPFNATVEGTREMSIAILQITSPIRELHRDGGDYRGVHYSLWGPVVEKDGIVKGATKPQDWKDLEPGTYLIRAKGSGPTTDVRIVLSTKDTPTDPFMQVGEIAADAPLAQHRLDAIYPFLGDINNRYLRQKAFLVAPRAAFVYARETLRAEDVTSGGSNPSFPQADEPLLVVGSSRATTVINAEGFEWDLRDTKLLAVQPAGAPTFPAAIHPLDLSYEDDTLTRGDEFENDAQAPLRKKLLASIESWNKCTDKVIAKHGGAAVNNYDVVTYRAGRVASVESMADKVWREADRTCKTKKVQAGWDAYAKQLSDALNAQRARKLDEIKQAWAK